MNGKGMVHSDAEGVSVPTRTEANTVAHLLADVIATGRRHPLGVAGIMIDAEIAAGRTPIQPGYSERFSFSSADWHTPAVVSLEGNEVRLVAILATNPGHGSLRRLVRAIENAGLRPVIVEPVGRVMPAILKRWGWKRRIKGAGEERLEEWRPGRDSSLSLAGYDGALRAGMNKDSPPKVLP